MNSTPPIAGRDDLGGLHRGLAEVAGDQLGAVDLDQLALATAGRAPGRCRRPAGRPSSCRCRGCRAKTRCRVMVGLLRPASARSCSTRSSCDLPVDLALDRGQPDQRVELGEQLLERSSRRLLGLGLRSRLRRGLLRVAGCAAGRRRRRRGTGGRPAAADRGAVMRRRWPDAGGVRAGPPAATDGVADHGDRAARRGSHAADATSASAGAYAARVRRSPPRRARRAARSAPARQRRARTAASKNACDRQPELRRPSPAARAGRRLGDGRGAARRPRAARVAGSSPAVAADRRPAPSSGAGERPPSPFTARVSRGPAMSSRVQRRRGRTSRRGTGRARPARRRRPGRRRRRSCPSSRRAGRAGRSAPSARSCPVDRPAVGEGARQPQVAADRLGQVVVAVAITECALRLPAPSRSSRGHVSRDRRA